MENNKLKDLISKVQKWFYDRNLHTQEPNKQFLKLYEEIGELSRGIAEKDEEVTKDSIGDISYIRSLGQKRDGVKTTDVGAIIPKEVLQPQKTPERQNPLLNLVRIVKVTSGSGSYPVSKKSNRKMTEVGELEENPDLGKTKIKEVDYKIKTYRGEIPLSREAIDDAQYDLIGIMQDDIQDQDEQTKLAIVADVFKTAKVVNASGYDGLKDILNTKISSVYKKSLVVTDSMFNALDKVKDKTGRYMLQPDITSPTGYSFSGKTIYPVDDTLLGQEGDMKYFIGDVEYFLTLFDRMELSVNWEDNHRFGKNLAYVLTLRKQMKMLVYLAHTLML